MSKKSNSTVTTLGVDIGQNSFRVVGLDQRGAIVLRQKWPRGQIQARLATVPLCLIGMEACVGAHHLSRKLQAPGHDARLMPAKRRPPPDDALASAPEGRVSTRPSCSAVIRRQSH
jgi:transposase